MSDLFVGLAVHAGVLEELAELDLLAGVERGRLVAEIGDRNLVLAKLARRERHSLVRSEEVAGRMQRDERGVHGVAGPAVGARLEGVADFLAAFARADLGEHGRTDRVLLGRVRPAYCGERGFVAVLGAVDDAVPAVIVGVLEVREEPGQRSPGRVLDLGGKDQPQTFVPAALEDLGLIDYVLDDLVAGGFSSADACGHGITGLTALRRRGRTLDL